MATTKDGRTIDVVRDTDLRRFRAQVGGEVAGDAEFLLTPDLVVFTHTEVSPAFEGQGIGSALIRWALDDVRKDGYAVVPTCPFVRSFIERNADEYADLVYQRPDEPAAS
jgi:uncharacterized protein